MLYMNKTLLSTIIATCLTMTNQAEAQNSNSFIGRQTPTIIERTFSPEAVDTILPLMLKVRFIT